MKNRSYKPANVPGLMPYLTVRDAKSSIDFYKKAFDFKVHDDPMKDSKGNIVYVSMTYHDTQIMFGPEGSFESPAKAPVTLGVLPSVSMYVYCQDVDSMYDRATKAGARTIMELQNTFWGDRVFKVADPDGHEWMFATNVGDFDPSKAPR